MSLAVNFNLSAVLTHRALQKADRSVSSSLERLSTGLRLNRSSDDPSSLVLANNLRYYLSGLGRAAQNAEEGVSMLQTTDGAMDQLNGLLLRMRSLALAAANEAIQDPDQLSALQSELDQAIASVTRISSDTRFGSISLLNGSLGGNTLSPEASEWFSDISFSSPGTPGGILPDSRLSLIVPPLGLTLSKDKVEVQLSTTAAPLATSPDSSSPLLGLFQGPAGFAAGQQITGVPPGTALSITGPKGSFSLPLDATSSIEEVMAQINSYSSLYGVRAGYSGGIFTVESTHFGAGTLTVEVNNAMTAGGQALLDSDPGVIGTNSFATAGIANQIQLDYTDASGGSHLITLDQQPLSGGGLVFTNLAGGPEAAPPYSAFEPGAFTVNAKDLSGQVVGSAISIPFSTEYYGTRSSSTVIQAGALANQRIIVDIPDLRASALGRSANLLSQGFGSLQALVNAGALVNGQADAALQVIDASIAEVSAVRGRVGSVQSDAVEATLASLQVSVGNLSGAESQLRDTDFAFESANFARQNILYQAATAMLAQANQVPQTVLQLLK